MSDYKNFSFRLVDIGLDIRNVADKVPQGKWTLLDNVQSLQEGSIGTRPGTTLVAEITLPTAVEPTDVHTIKRIGPVDAVLGPTTSGAQILILGVGQRLYRNNTSGIYGSTTAWSGNPLAVVPFKPRLSNITWSYIGDSNKMRKIDDKGVEYKWGIAAPEKGAIFGVATSSGTPLSGNLNSSAVGAIVYDWRYTYYSTRTGAESNPSPTVSPGVAVASGRATITVAPSTDPQVDQIRLYRRGGVNGGFKWRFAVSSDNIATQIEDNQSDESIALNESLRDTNDVPFTSVGADGSTLKEVPTPYIVGPFIGKYMIACGDVNRPGHVYWTNPEEPDAASPENNLQVTSPQEPLIGAMMYGSQPFLWTRDNLYKLDYGGPQAIPTFVSKKTGCGRGIAGPWAFDVGPLIFFVSQDGIYVTDGDNPAECITEEAIRPLFFGNEIVFFAEDAEEIFYPIDFDEPRYIRLSYAGQELHFTYKDINGDPQHLIYHTIYKRWRRRTSPSMEVRTVYAQENSPILKVFYGGYNGVVELQNQSIITDRGMTVESVARTGFIDMGLPHTVKEYGNYILDVAIGSGTLEVTPFVYRKEEPYATTPTSVPTTPVALDTQSFPAASFGPNRQKISISLEDTYAYAIAFEFRWTGDTKLYAFELLWREDEEEVRHWEFPETSHGLSGWQHVRDLYLSIRSLAEIELRVEVDGEHGEKIYQIPSTEGERRKVLVHLRPYKGKVFRYILDSDDRFSVYGEDCEVRVKSWNTALSYKLVSPFAQTEGGT